VVDAAPPENPSGHLWQAPGKRLSVHLSQTAVCDIVKSGRRRSRRRQESGGVLLGLSERGEDGVRVKVERAVEVPSEHLFGPRYSLSEADKELLEEVVEESTRSRDGLTAVGFYRTHARKGLGLDQDDLALFEERFPGPDCVALVVKRRWLRPSRAGFFFREEDRIHSQASYRELRLHAGAARRGAPVWCSWWAQAPLFACLLAAYALLGFASARQWNALRPATASPHDPYRLSLLVLEYGDNLHLSWDRHAPAIEAGGTGIVHVSDGGQIRRLELTHEQLRSGSITYLKGSSHVRFQLEVFVKPNLSVSETWESAPRPTP
ncbi:MAG TPA: hypothetical protein VF767_04150, partial [Bryobacteraceae bacterium]